MIMVKKEEYNALGEQYGVLLEECLKAKDEIEHLVSASIKDGADKRELEHEIKCKDVEISDLQVQLARSKLVEKQLNGDITSLRFSIESFKWCITEISRKG